VTRLLNLEGPMTDRSDTTQGRLPLSGAACLPVTADGLAHDAGRLRELLGRIKDPFWEDVKDCLDPRLDWLVRRLDADLHVVFTPGKVGSRTIQATIQDHPGVGHAYHLHALGPVGLRRLDQLIAQFPQRGDAWRIQQAFAHWLRQFLGLRRLVGRKTYVLCAVRDPVAMMLSAHFESWWRLAESPADLTADLLRSRFEARDWFDWYGDWYTQELAAVFQVDPFGRPFPVGRGWDIFDNELARVLIVRLEDFGRLPEALGALYGRPAEQFPVRTTNCGAEKTYADHYRLACQSLRVSEQVLAEIYDMPFVRQFYSAAEIERFKDRWRAPQAPSAAA
jgi:hypothetical protein